MATIAEALQIKLKASREAAAAKAHYEALAVKAQEAGKNYREAVAVKQTGLDRPKIDEALSVLEIRGTYDRAGNERASALSDAICDVADGCQKLRQSYLGTKSYDRWHGQRSDHPYGYGPTHGSTIFSIGLRREYRDADLSNAQIDACIYLLENLQTFQAAQREAEAA
ncbi:MAG: hypothetical protein AAF737_04140 [Pseudomonadota bacterium]